jgi:hypothetical protein
MIGRLEDPGNDMPNVVTDLPILVVQRKMMCAGEISAAWAVDKCGQIGLMRALQQLSSGEPKCPRAYCTQQLE